MLGEEEVFTAKSWSDAVIVAAEQIVQQMGDVGVVVVLREEERGIAVEDSEKRDEEDRGPGAESHPAAQP